MNNIHPVLDSQAATGAQFEIRRGEAEATVVSLAAGLRRYQRAGIDLVESYGVDVTAPGGAGITLAPFANRIDGGKWVLDGKEQQMDITEVARNNAIHGLLRNAGYDALEHSEHRVVLSTLIYPQHGYPFLLRHQVSYELDAEGHLRVTQTLFNLSQKAAPFVLGAHPYLRVGDADPATLTITVDAQSYLEADQRMIPTATHPVEGIYDLRRGRVVAQSQMDTAFTGLASKNGQSRHTLRTVDGRTVSLWHDSSVDFVHVFITTEFPGRSFAVAIEPMTGPANSFNSGDGLKWLEPGEQFAMNWGIESSL